MAILLFFVIVVIAVSFKMLESYLKEQIEIQQEILKELKAQNPEKPKPLEKVGRNP